MMYELPKSVEISGVEYGIRSDYRPVLDICAAFSDVELSSQEKIAVALIIFYPKVEQIPPRDMAEALKQCFWFIRCGKPDLKADVPKRIDWEQDSDLIFSDINRVSGREVRELPYCHWWTFMAWFNAIGEGQLSTVVSIRDKRRKGKKLADWEQEYYRENREKIDFKTEYTPEEEALLQKMLGK